jgi:hypothetical protein
VFLQGEEEVNEDGTLEDGAYKITEYVVRITDEESGQPEEFGLSVLQKHDTEDLTYLGRVTLAIRTGSGQVASQAFPFPIEAGNLDDAIAKIKDSAVDHIEKLKQAAMDHQQQLAVPNKPKIVVPTPTTPKVVDIGRPPQ